MQTMDNHPYYALARQREEQMRRLARRAHQLEPREVERIDVPARQGRFTLHRHRSVRLAG